MMLTKNVRLIRNKRAVSAVISNLILIAAVIAVGFSVLAWTQYQSSTYQKAQSDIISQDISQLQERLALEYTYYASGILKVFLLNPGPVNVIIQTVFLSTSPGSPVSFSLYNFDNPPLIISTLYTGAQTREGYIQVSTGSLSPGSYSVTIITSKGSAFVYNFVTST
jgi:hypothetical protein